MSVILVCGDRHWNNWPIMVRSMQLHITCDDTVIHGACRGADSMADRIAREQIGATVKVFPADWNTFGKYAGPKRNRQMLDIADKVLAFHEAIEDSKGTKDVIDEAARRGIPFVLIDGP